MASQNPPAIFIKIDEAMRAGEVVRATALARRALDSGHTDPVLFSLRSHWHEGKGRLEAALSDLMRALALAPQSARTLASMGRCLCKLGRFEEAMEHLDLALAREPDLAVAHYEKGFALEQMGELRLAKNSYEQSQAFAPNMANATARLSGLASRRSDWDETERLANTALTLEPGNAIAHFALVTRGYCGWKFRRR